MSLTPPLPCTALPLRADEKEYQLCYNAFDSKSRGGDTNQSRKSLYAISTKEKSRETHASFLHLVHLFSRGRGPSFVKEPRRFSVQAVSRAALCVLRGGGRFLFDASGVARARVTTRALTSLPHKSRPQSNNHPRAAARCGGLS